MTTELYDHLPHAVDSIMLFLKKHDMRQGVSKIRNHVIARIFRELKLIEQWGSGVRRMFREAEELGLPAPEIAEVGMRLRLTAPLAQPLTIQKGRGEVAPKVRLESRLESRLAAKVVLILQGGEAGKSSLAAHLGHKSVSGELHKQIKRLLEFEMIEMTIPDKPKSRLQKYRLTAKGKATLDEIMPALEDTVKRHVPQ